MIIVTTRRELFDRLVEAGKLNRGIIEGFSGSWMSGLGHLIIDGIPVPCENGPTVRALESCFGDVITPGHMVRSTAIQGREIYWSMDDMGLILQSFTSVDNEELDDEIEFDPEEFGLEKWV